jgi:hypothetical protein
MGLFDGINNLWATGISILLFCAPLLGCHHDQQRERKEFISQIVNTLVDTTKVFQDEWRLDGTTYSQLQERNPTKSRVKPHDILTTFETPAKQYERFLKGSYSSVAQDMGKLDWVQKEILIDTILGPRPDSTYFDRYEYTVMLTDNIRVLELLILLYESGPELNGKQKAMKLSGIRWSSKTMREVIVPMEMEMMRRERESADTTVQPVIEQ